MEVAHGEDTNFRATCLLNCEEHRHTLNFKEHIRINPKPAAPTGWLIIGKAPQTGIDCLMTSSTTSLPWCRPVKASCCCAE
ncbi:hypothetical protein WJX72_010433 [[Myrmecia] bisecta]|uniref:Uncharacterized protein n=1 Tax=[Myrmecia] bisecta TaxID=41462 RepID=A0AAW1P2M9_9CHLO